MSFKDLRDGYENSNKDKKPIELSAEEKELLKTQNIDNLSSRVKLRLAYLKAMIEKQEERCDDNGNPEA
ncbi:MAG: hypothetical protein ACE3JP_08250 [Ectobacillus sp.]